MQTLYVSSIKLHWYNAKLFCKNFGLELLTPESQADDEAIRSSFQNLDDKFHATLQSGATSRGFDAGWYSANSGRVLHFNIEWKDSLTRTFENKECLQLARKEDQSFAYQTVDCFESQEHFICRNVAQDNIEVN